MPRLKNQINDKERKTQCVMTEGSVVYKVPLGAEEDKLGHYIESEKVGKTLVFRFAIKRPDFPALKIEQKEEFFVNFN
jgi:hypothetical protein